MRVVITLEDTAEGLACDRKVSFSGVNDGAERSLAILVAAYIETHLARLDRRHAIRVTARGELSAKHLPAPRR